jgi:hypothetical protein
MTQVIEYLHSKYKALSTNPSTAKKNAAKMYEISDFINEIYSIKVDKILPNSYVPNSILYHSTLL